MREIEASALDGWMDAHASSRQLTNGVLAVYLSVSCVVSYRILSYVLF